MTWFITFKKHQQKLPFRWFNPLVTREHPVVVLEKKRANVSSASATVSVNFDALNIWNSIHLLGLGSGVSFVAESLSRIIVRNVIYTCHTEFWILIVITRLEFNWPWLVKRTWKNAFMSLSQSTPRLRIIKVGDFRHCLALLDSQTVGITVRSFI